GRLIAAREPDGLADGRAAVLPTDRSGVEHPGPPMALARRIDPERPLDGDRTRDPREHSVAHPMLVHAPPPDREQERAHERERERRPGRSFPADRRGRDRVPKVAWTGLDETGALERPGTFHPPGREGQCRADQPPADRHPAPGAGEPAETWWQRQAGPDEGCERRRDPGAHTGTSSRIDSKIASPMPLTSRSSSTVANGPFSVR